MPPLFSRHLGTLFAERSSGFGGQVADGFVAFGGGRRLLYIAPSRSFLFGAGHGHLHGVNGSPSSHESRDESIGPEAVSASVSSPAVIRQKVLTPERRTSRPRDYGITH
jgi:hypothetical protein